MTTALHYHWIPTSTTTSHSSNFYQQHHPAYLLKESPLHSDLPTTQPQLQGDLWTHTAYPHPQDGCEPSAHNGRSTYGCGTHRDSTRYTGLLSAEPLALAAVLPSVTQALHLTRHHCLAEYFKRLTRNHMDIYRDISSSTSPTPTQATLHV